MTHQDAINSIKEILEYAIDKNKKYKEITTTQQLQLLYDFVLELELLIQETKKQQYEKINQAKWN